jgi:hypothetical protein
MNNVPIPSVAIIKEVNSHSIESKLCRVKTKIRFMIICIDIVSSQRRLELTDSIFFKRVCPPI